MFNEKWVNYLKSFRFALLDAIAVDAVENWLAWNDQQPEKKKCGKTVAKIAAAFHLIFNMFAQLHLKFAFFCCEQVCWTFFFPMIWTFWKVKYRCFIYIWSVVFISLCAMLSCLWHIQKKKNPMMKFSGKPDVMTRKRPEHARSHSIM